MKPIIGQMEDRISGVIFFHTNRLETTNEELAEWAKGDRKMISYL